MKKWIELLKKNTTANCRLCCFHHAGAGASTFYPWINLLPQNIELVAVQLPGHETRFSEPYLTSAQSIIEGLFEEIIGFLEKPLFLFGHSLGALLAFELVKALARTNLPSPEHLIVSGCKAPHSPLRREPFRDLPDSKFIEKLREYNGIPQIMLDNKNQLLKFFLPIIRADFTIFETYQHNKLTSLPCHITAISGQNDPFVYEADVKEWQHYTRSAFQHFSVVGNHFFIRTAQTDIIKIIQQIMQKYV